MVHFPVFSSFPVEVATLHKLSLGAMERLWQCLHILTWYTECVGDGDTSSFKDERNAKA